MKGDGEVGGGPEASGKTERAGKHSAPEASGKTERPKGRASGKPSQLNSISFCRTAIITASIRE